MTKSPILDAIDQICEEKNIPRQSVLDTIEAALAVAYRKDFGEKNQNIKTEFDPNTAQARVFDVKEVVEDELYEEYIKQQEEIERLKAEGADQETIDAAMKKAHGEEVAEKTEPQPKPETAQTAEGKKEQPTDEADATEEVEEEKVRRFDPKSMIALSEITKTKPDASIGDEIRTELFPPENYGRMAAQTAKQVIIQRLREAERETTFEEYKDKVGEILTGTIQRIEGRVVLVDLGRTTAVMPPSEQIDRERYTPGQRVKVYIAAVTQTTRGPEILVSRAHPDMVRKLFELEVPEVASGSIDIKAVAREAGSRTKIAVHTTEPNIDPVGSCVGQRGTRVQTIIAEIGGEKIDIIQYEEDAVRFIINALSPAKILSVTLHEEEKRAVAEVKEDQLSLAIGRAGQNVRLAAKLTGWKIDIMKESSDEVAASENSEGEAAEKADEKQKQEADAPVEQPTDDATNATEQSSEPDNTLKESTPEATEEAPADASADTMDADKASEEPQK